MEISLKDALLTINGQTVQLRDVLELILTDEKSLMTLRDWIDERPIVEKILR